VENMQPVETIYSKLQGVTRTNRDGSQRQLTVSHFRMALLKRVIPTKLLVALDSGAQLTGDWWQLTPSVFTCSQAVGQTSIASTGDFFRCPACGQALVDASSELTCTGCGKNWPIINGIYDFRDKE